MHPLAARALADLGLVEHPGHPFATAARPWCNRFAVEVLRDCGVFIPADEAIEWSVLALMRHLGARGFSVPHAGPFVAGDLVAFPRKPSGAHVGIVCAVEPGRVEVVSGNSAAAGSRRADRVTRRWYPVGRVAWAARPIPAATPRSPA